MTLSTETLKEELNGNHFKNNFPLYNASFGDADSIDHSAYDIASIAKQKLETEDAVCNFHVICGSDEFIRSRAEKDVQILKDIGYDVNYICSEGYSHDFILWDKYIKLALDELLPLNR